MSYNNDWDDEEAYEAQLNRSALWAVSYGDLMSYLMIFFLVLYASTVSGSVAMQMSIEGMKEEFSKEKGVINALFSRHGVQKFAKLEIGEDKMRIVFSNPVLFEIGSAQLKKNSLKHLDKLVEVFIDMPNPIQIEGHTDNIPLGKRLPFDSNWELSAARAFAVLRYFEDSGVPSGRLSAIGYGEFRPVETNETIKGRSANRRIEINLVRRKS